MKKLSDTQSFSNLDDSARDQTDEEDAEKKEKYLREAGKIEDLPNNDELEKMNNPQALRNQFDQGGQEKNGDDVRPGKRVEDSNHRRNSL